MNAKDIFLQAESFYHLSLVSFKDAWNKIEFAQAGLLAGISLQAFSCELYFKAVYNLENNSTARHHRLDDLFMSLSRGAQTRIEQIYDAKSENSPQNQAILTGLGFGHVSFDIITVLTAARLDFVKYRYAFEIMPLTDQIRHLWYVAKAARTYIIEQKPEWPVLADN